MNPDFYDKELKRQWNVKIETLIEIVIDMAESDGVYLKPREIDRSESIVEEGFFDAIQKGYEEARIAG